MASFPRDMLMAKDDVFDAVEQQFDGAFFCVVRHQGHQAKDSAHTRAGPDSFIGIVGLSISGINRGAQSQSRTLLSGFLPQFVGPENGAVFLQLLSPDAGPVDEHLNKKCFADIGGVVEKKAVVVFFTILKKDRSA